MSSGNSFLEHLLNDDSFISWVKRDENLNYSDQIKWDKWLHENPNRKKLVCQAKKILEMPFKEIPIDCNKSKELDRLLKKLKTGPSEKK